MNIVTPIIAVVLSYLVGSIPSGLIIVRILTGKDILAEGSGRTGGANALRAGGVPAGILTGVSDLAKGIAAVGIGSALGSGSALVIALCAIAVVAGHNWSVYIGFRGGAGTGPNAGAAIALWPVSALILVPAVPVLLALTGYASVTSTVVGLIIVAIFGIRALIGTAPVAFLGYALVTMILVAISLLPNYRRLRDGTERLVGPRASAASRRTKPVEMAVKASGDID